MQAYRRRDRETAEDLFDLSWSYLGGVSDVDRILRVMWDFVTNVIQSPDDELTSDAREMALQRGDTGIARMIDEANLVLANWLDDATCLICLNQTSAILEGGA